jgi:galactokinase
MTSAPQPSSRPTATTVADAFEALSGRAPDGVWSSPGRVNLIGEHTDYNDGFALPFAIAARVWAAVATRADGVLRMRSVQQPGDDIEVSLHDLAPGRPGGWAAHVAGVVWAARQAGYPVSGADVLVDGRVPLGSGLSSSHALECAVITALDALQGTGLGPNQLALLALVAENDFVGAPTGMMDQIASLRATAGHALFLDNRSLDVEQVPLNPAGAGLRLLVLNTRVHHGNADGAYGDRRAACERAARLLDVAALRDVAAEDLDDALGMLPDELHGRVRHVVTEDDRVLDAVTALRAGDWSRLGALMDASHESLRVDYEVSCDELDVAVAAAGAAGALGARMTGGGFGGSAIALVPVASVGTVGTSVIAAFARQGWAAPEIVEVTPSEGARRDA